MRIVKNLNTLKAMQKLGHIKFCDQTGKIIETLYSRIKHTCYYVDDGEREFTYKHKKYGVKYFDGCFMPYVVELETPEDISKSGVILGL